MLGENGTISIGWTGLESDKLYLSAIVYSDSTSDIGTTYVRIDSVL